MPEFEVAIPREPDAQVSRVLRSSATALLLCLVAGAANAQDTMKPDSAAVPVASQTENQPGSQDNGGVKNDGKNEQIMNSGRFTMTPAPNGFLRLDTQTGAVSLCAVKEGRVTCQSSADDRAALEAEISRLVRRNAELQKNLADASRSTREKLRDVLPSDKEMNKALSYAEQFMRRMMRIMREDEKPPEKDRI